MIHIFAGINQPDYLTQKSCNKMLLIIFCLFNFILIQPNAIGLLNKELFALCILIQKQLNISNIINILNNK